MTRKIGIHSGVLGRGRWAARGTLALASGVSVGRRWGASAGHTKLYRASHIYRRGRGIPTGGLGSRSGGQPLQHCFSRRRPQPVWRIRLRGGVQARQT